MKIHEAVFKLDRNNKTNFSYHSEHHNGVQEMALEIIEGLDITRYPTLESFLDSKKHVSSKTVYEYVVGRQVEDKEYFNWFSANPEASESYISHYGYNTKIGLVNNLKESYRHTLMMDILQCIRLVDEEYLSEPA